MRGDALSARSRGSAKFEVLYVDAMGHPRRAEELDVWVERFGRRAARTSAPPPREQLADVGAAVPKNSRRRARRGQGGGGGRQGGADAAEINAMEQMWWDIGRRRRGLHRWAKAMTSSAGCRSRDPRAFVGMSIEMGSARPDGRAMAWLGAL